MPASYGKAEGAAALAELQRLPDLEEAGAAAPEDGASLGSPRVAAAGAAVAVRTGRMFLLLVISLAQTSIVGYARLGCGGWCGGGGGQDAAVRGGDRARSHCRFAPPLTHFMSCFLTYSVPLFLNRQCGRTLGGDRAGLSGGH